MRSVNKREHKRLRLDRSVRIPVQLFPQVPFIGPSVPATIMNLSAGGMAFTVGTDTMDAVPQRGIKLKIHFRLPGRPLQECWGTVSHSFLTIEDRAIIGIRFDKCPLNLRNDFESMALDNETCDHRLEQRGEPWCLPTCNYYELCRKPLRPMADQNIHTDRLEIVLQTREQT